MIRQLFRIPKQIQLRSFYCVSRHIMTMIHDALLSQCDHVLMGHIMVHHFSVAMLYMTFLAMNQFSGGSRQKNKLYTGHLFLKQPRIFIQPSHQPFDLEQKCINLCPSQTCPVQKSSCLLGGS